LVLYRRANAGGGPFLEDPEEALLSEIQACYDGAVVVTAHDLGGFKG
jgi:hypothetical protein